LKMGRTGCPETSVTNHKSTLRNCSKFLYVRTYCDTCCL